MQMADRVAILVDGSLVALEDVPVFHDFVTSKTAVRVVLSEITDAIADAARNAGAAVTMLNRTQLSFTAIPEQRLDVIRAIEEAGGTIEEFHTEAPDWEALIRSHYVARGNPS